MQLFSLQNYIRLFRASFWETVLIKTNSIPVPMKVICSVSSLTIAWSYLQNSVIVLIRSEWIVIIASPTSKQPSCSTSILCLYLLVFDRMIHITRCFIVFRKQLSFTFGTCIISRTVWNIFIRFSQPIFLYHTFWKKNMLYLIEIFIQRKRLIITV